MKKSFLIWLLITLLIIFVSLTNFTSSSFTKGNLTAGIEENYVPGDIIKGWINISLQNEAASSLLKAFSNSISILDFLRNNSLNSSDFACSVLNCEPDYSASNSERSKSFSLEFGKSKIIGFRISGDIESIDSFSMNITSDAMESNYPQLFIDILDDNSSEWQAHSPSGSFGGENYGCYNSAETSGQAEITQTEYCEKIKLPFSSNVKVGAEVNKVAGKVGNVTFEMHIYNDDYDETCTASASTSGKISCIVNLSTAKEQDFFVCIRTEDSDDDRNYSVSYERNAPCGFSGDYDDSYTLDFAIFAQAGKYAPIRNFVLNNDELEKIGSENSNIESYIEEELIDEKYNGNCSNGCVVPVKFVSMAQQTITISSASLAYVSEISTTTHDIYELTKESAKINMGFKKLNLEKASFVIPSIYGNQTLSLKLNDQEIVSKRIKIRNASLTIERVIPLRVPAAMPVKFIVFVSGNVAEYRWDFGDESQEEATATNKTSHTYSRTGTYTLKVTAENENGETSKTFSIDVISPKEEINITLAEKKEKLNKTKQKLDSITEWYKGKIREQVKLDDIESKLSRLERDYITALEDNEDKYAEIMANLTELKIPSLNILSYNGFFVPGPENVKAEYLKKLTGEDIENPEEYGESIISWINEQLDVSLENKVYSLQYGEEVVNLISAIVLKIHPKEDFGKEVYLIIDRNYDELTFKTGIKAKAVEEATAVTFSELEKDKEEVVEFILPEKIELTEMPFYLSPKFSKLPKIDTGPCNNNKICEKEIGETAENCINDCASWWQKQKSKIIWLSILLIAAFVVYIVLQEWYKRHYENHLFRNKNDIFNLVCFMSNALTQKLDKSEIAKKLKEFRWTGEQINYAFKKTLGKRTGMWEIPIFRAFEKRKLNKEIERRRQAGLIQPAPYSQGLR